MSPGLEKLLKGITFIVIMSFFFNLIEMKK